MQRVDEAMRDVEKLLQEVIGPRPAIRSFLAARHVARAVEGIPSKPRHHLTWIGARRVLELAIWKFGRRDTTGLDLPDREERIINWQADEIKLLAHARLLAIAHYNLANWCRRLAKGQSLRACGGLGMLPVVRDVSEQPLPELIDRWERRMENRSDDLLSTIGQFSLWDEDDSPVLAASFAPLEMDDEPLPVGSIRVHARDVTFFPLRLPFLALERFDAIYGECLRRLGTSLWDLVLLMASATAPLVRHFARFVRDTSDRRAAVVMTTLLRRGCFLRSESSWDAFAEDAELVRVAIPELSGRDYRGFAPARSLLTTEPDEIDLRDRTPHGPIHWIGDTAVYDLVSAGAFLQLTLANLKLSESERLGATRKFERDMHRALATFGHQPFPSGKELRRGGDLVTDIDASCIVGGTLVMVDTYSSPRDTSIDRGEYARTRNRSEALMAKLVKWKERAMNLAENPVGDNFDLLALGVTRILPVVVTAAVEWIASTEPWFTPEQEDCTANELVRMLSALAASPAHARAIPVRGG
jgi:hypothetical protein